MGEVAAGFSLPDLQGEVVCAVGTDVIEVSRVRLAIDRQVRFVDRVFTVAEREYCLSAGAGNTVQSQRFAVRFAAKEAGLKALGVGLGGAGFQDFEILHRPSGQPVLSVTGRAAEIADSLGINSWLISLSHCETVAQAFVVGVG